MLWPCACGRDLTSRWNGRFGYIEIGLHRVHTLHTLHTLGYHGKRPFAPVLLLMVSSGQGTESCSHTNIEDIIIQKWESTLRQVFKYAHLWYYMSLYIEPIKMHSTKIPWLSGHKQTIPTEQPQLVCEFVVPTFADRRVTRGQCGRSPTVVNLSFLDRSRYFSF
jgi:hypothetical protein